jgi:hypothetical protein
MIHLPAVHLSDIPCPPLQAYLRNHRETKHLFTCRAQADPQEILWGYFDPDGDAWIYPHDSAAALPFPTSEIERLPADSFYELER